MMRIVSLMLIVCILVLALLITPYFAASLVAASGGSFTSTFYLGLGINVLVIVWQVIRILIVDQDV